MPEILTKLKLQVPAGQATPAPPVGPALGQHGVNIQDFVTKFNDMTKDMEGDVIPVEVTIYRDRSLSLKLKTPPASELLKKAAKLDKGSDNPKLKKVGKVSADQIRAIAERKMVDLSARDLDTAISIVEGTARSMGITVQ